jgi:tRNA-2-methylthio-N6-dimethylallyladenosine synthase
MTTGLMDAMAEASPVVCPYLHLPVQSGSTSVLRDMKRGYRREGYLRKIEQLRSRIPDIVFGTDIIVGFPTETDADFRQTLSLLDEVRFDTCYSFAYSPRPGTGALALGDGLPQEGKMDRLAELQEHQKAIQERLAHRWIDRTVEVLVEGPSKRDAGEWTGRTPENRVVNFAGPSGPGRFEDLKIVRSTAFSLRGRPAAGEA